MEACEIGIMAAASARRSFLVECAASERSIRVAGTAPTFAALRSLMAETTVDVAILDWDPDREPTGARDWLDELLQDVSVLVLIGAYDADIHGRITQARAGGILRTDSSAEQIVHAVQSLAAGLMVFDGAVMPARSEESLSVETLTTREHDVLRLLAEGLSNREIASRLNISEHTIKFHIRSILGKLGASTRTEAVSRGLRSGLIEL